jgi:hypothetical protein
MIIAGYMQQAQIRQDIHKTLIQQNLKGRD